MSSNSAKYALALSLGAVGGGLLVAWVTDALPKMMSGIMQNMMVRMQEEGCDPKEM